MTQNTQIGDLLIKIRGNTYLIPAELIGKPLEDNGTEILPMLEKEMAMIGAANSGIEFVMELGNDEAPAADVRAERQCSRQARQCVRQARQCDREARQCVREARQCTRESRQCVREARQCNRDARQCTRQARQCSRQAHEHAAA